MLGVGIVQLHQCAMQQFVAQALGELIKHFIHIGTTRNLFACVGDFGLSPVAGLLLYLLNEGHYASGWVALVQQRIK